MKWLKSIFNKDPDKNLLKVNKRMPKNVYKGKTFSQHQKKFHILHYVFKYKFLVPLLSLSQYLLRKVMVKKVKKESHNENIYIFDKAFESALKKWCDYYRAYDLKKKGKLSKKALNKMYKKDYACQHLRTMKELVMTMYMYDTAYREFVNILMHEITIKMHKEYSKYGGKTGHLFFTTDIYDVNYYVLEKLIKYNVDLNIIDAKRFFKEETKKSKK